MLSSGEKHIILPFEKLGEMDSCIWFSEYFSVNAYKGKILPLHVAETRGLIKQSEGVFWIWHSVTKVELELTVEKVR